MAGETFLVGNGAGFSGDRVDAPIPVVRSLVRRGLPAALFFETLGERTVALAQLERRRDPELGYEPMLERLLEPVLAECFAHRIPILGNFGAANPPAAARLRRNFRRLVLESRRSRIMVVLPHEGDETPAAGVATRNACDSTPMNCSPSWPTAR